MVTREEVLDRLTYDEDTGVFTYRRKVGRGSVGSVAGNIGTRGYISIIISGRHYRAHRLAWLCVYGEFPTSDIDHIDGNRTNNARANLRLCTQSQNNANTGKRLNNKSGLKGVCWHSRAGKWGAQIKINGRQKHLGYFVDKYEAAAVYERALVQNYGEFARTE